MRINCADCSQERLVNTNGESKESYLKKYPVCRRCGAMRVKDKISKGWFNKGQKPWNINTKGLMPKPWNKGTKGLVKINSGSFKKEDHIGEKNWNWKGDGVGYFALHGWIQRKKGKARHCLFAKTLYNDCSKTFEWANISHEYKRDLDDWASLCSKHHDDFDRKKDWGIATRRFNL